MKNKYFLLAVVGLILLSAVALRIMGVGNDKKAAAPQVNGPTSDSDHGSTVPTPGLTQDMEATFSKEALVVAPKQNEVIKSPLEIKGNVVGPWFFEGSLPVKLVDADENIIVSGQARAEGDWMTVKPVPFNGSLEFSTMATSGYLIISKDNPSGLKENDGFIKIPVKFK